MFKSGQKEQVIKFALRILIILQFIIICYLIDEIESLTEQIENSADAIFHATSKIERLNTDLYNCKAHESSCKNELNKYQDETYNN